MDTGVNGDVFLGCPLVFESPKRVLIPGVNRCKCFFFLVRQVLNDACGSTLANCVSLFPFFPHFMLVFHVLLAVCLYVNIKNTLLASCWRASVHREVTPESSQQAFLVSFCVRFLLTDRATCLSPKVWRSETLLVYCGKCPNPPYWSRVHFTLKWCCRLNISALFCSIVRRKMT